MKEGKLEANKREIIKFWINYVIKYYQCYNKRYRVNCNSKMYAK